MRVARLRNREVGSRVDSVHACDTGAQISVFGLHSVGDLQIRSCSKSPTPRPGLAAHRSGHESPGTDLTGRARSRMISLSEIIPVDERPMPCGSGFTPTEQILCNDRLPMDRRRAVVCHFFFPRGQSSSHCRPGSRISHAYLPEWLGQSWRQVIYVRRIRRDIHSQGNMVTRPGEVCFSRLKLASGSLVDWVIPSHRWGPTRG